MAGDESGFPRAAVSLETRRTALQGQISYYMRKGYRVASQTDTTAQLIKPKKFSLLVFLVCVILAVLPAVLYVAYYIAKRDPAVYVVVDEWGNVSTTM